MKELLITRVVPFFLLATFIVLINRGYSVAERTPHVTWKGRGKLFVISFPGDWYKKTSKVGAGKTVLPDPARYEVRAINTDGQENLMFKEISGNGDESENQYFVSLMPKVEVHPVGSEEWEKGKKLNQSLGEGMGGPASVAIPNYYTYNGVKLSKSGDTWGSSYGELSPTKEWLVLFSYTGEGDFRQGFFGGEEKVPHKGKVYLDVYGVRPPLGTNKSADVQAVYTYKDTAPVINKTLWVEDKYLVLPIDHFWKTCIVWQIPR